MAQIDILPQSLNGDLTVRPTRIGPEQPENFASRTLGASAETIGKVFEGIQKQQDQNDYAHAHVLMGQLMNDATLKLEQTPFTDPKSYLAKAKELSDPQTVMQQLPSTVSNRVRKLAASNLSVLQNEFMTKQTGKVAVLAHQKAVGDLDASLDGYANLMATADPSLYPLYKQQGLDAIKASSSITPEEKEVRQKGFLNKADFLGASNYALHDPTNAINTFMDDKLMAQHYPNLTAEQRFEVIGHAHRQLENAEQANHREWRALGDDALGHALNMMNGKEPVNSQWLAHAERAHLLPAGVYYNITGQDSPGDPELTKSTLSEIDQAQSSRELDAIRNGLLMDPRRYSTDERKQITAYTQERRSTLNTALGNSRKTLATKLNTAMLQFNKQYGTDPSLDKEFAADIKQSIRDAQDQARYMETSKDVDQLLKDRIENMRAAYESTYAPTGPLPKTIPNMKAGDVTADPKKVNAALEAAGKVNAR